MPDLDQLLDSLVTDVSDHTRPPGAPTAIKQAHRRRTRSAVAAMVAAAAVIGGTAVTVNRLDDARTAPPLEQPDTNESPALTTPLTAPASLLDVDSVGFHVAEVEGVQVNESWGLDDDGQWTTVDMDRADGEFAAVKVHYQGRSLRPLTGTSEDVRVNGLPGTYTEAVVAGGFTTRLSWQYAPDAWAEVGISGDGRPSPGTKQFYLAVAEAVRTGGPAVRVPVRFDSAPASLPQLAKADQVTFAGRADGWTMYVWLDDDVVSVTSAVDLGECRGEGGEPPIEKFTLHGYRGCVVPVLDGERVDLHLDGIDAAYETGSGPALPREDVKRLLDGVTVSPFPDPATWFDLRTSLMG